MKKQIPHEIIDRAAEWFIDMREIDVPDDKREAFTEWLRASPAHVQAYLEIAGAWGDASQVSKEFVVEMGAAATNVVPIDTQPQSLISHAQRGGEPSRRGEAHYVRREGAESSRRMRVLALAASLLLIIATATTWWWQTTRYLYTTEVGEQRVLTLDDGSIVRLNSRSKVRVQLTPEERHIELLEGQAHFQVAKDAARPFTVRTDDITARAVGTQFDVYRRKTGTTVTVIEGRVAVEKGNASADSGAGAQRKGEVLLAAGEQLTASLAGAVHLLPQANIAAATGWLQQELIFTGEPLKDVIDEFNRYTRRTIVLDDPTLADHKINAAFNTTNPQSLLLFLSHMDGVQINETGNEIHITRRE
jgi:transmembrane sensor